MSCDKKIIDVWTLMWTPNRISRLLVNDLNGSFAQAAYVLKNLNVLSGNYKTNTNESPCPDRFLNIT